MKKSVLKLALASAVCAAFFMGCAKKESASGPSVAVFVPGIMADSPTYANFAAGFRMESTSTIQKSAMKK